MVGPEVVFALSCNEPLLYLNLNFGAAANLRLFVLAADGSGTCLGVTGVGGVLVMQNLGPGRYFVVVDGPEAGTYFFSVHCLSAGPSPTPTTTPTPTATQTLTSTRTSTPTATPLGHQVFLPMMIKRFRILGFQFSQGVIQWTPWKQF
jgi:hypothetical protein